MPMASDRSDNCSNSTNEVPASLVDFAAKAYSKESPILIADGSMNQLDDYNAAQKQQERTSPQVEQRPLPVEPRRQPPTIEYAPAVPQVYCPQPVQVDPGYYNYRPGTMHCRRVYEPIQPMLPHPVDRRKAWQHPHNPVVQATMSLALELDKHPIYDTHPSDISRRDLSAAFLNMILQRAINRQTSGNTIEEIAGNLDNVQDLTNHFHKHPIGEQQPGDIIIAYPLGACRPEAAIYMDNGLVASYDQTTKRITSKDTIANYYPPPPGSKQAPIFSRVVLYRWGY